LDAGGEGQGQGKLIVLLTDGEDHKGGIDEALKQVESSKAKVITVGMASTGGSPIQDTSGGFVKDRAGNVVISKLDEKILRDISSHTGGVYLSADEVGASVAAVYQNTIRAKGTIQETESRRERLWYERFQWPAALALILLVLDCVISETRLRASAIVVGLASLLSMAPRVAYAGTSNVERYNAGVAALAGGDQENARKVFDELARSATGEARRRSLYNLANLIAAEGKLEDAVKFYEEALAMDYQDQQVRDNLAWARKAKKKQDQKKQDEQKQDQKENQNNNQNNNQQNQQDQDNKKDQDQKQDPKDQQNKNSQQKQEQKQNQKQNQDEQSNQKNQPNTPQQSETMTPEEAEKLLRAAPDDRKSMTPIYRGEHMPPKSVDQDW
jgi:Ca-activated chloride channel family protein